MGPRRRGRELAFQILFQVDQSGDKVNAVMARFEDLGRAKPEAAAFAEALAVGACREAEKIDAWIREAATHWKLERLLSVDRALLRLGACELALHPETPAEVVLDECIELAKAYGSEESPDFVNGVLDALKRRLRPEEGGEAAPGPGSAKPKGKSMSPRSKAGA